MAKQTRAQRKKQKQHATPAPIEVNTVEESGVLDVEESTDENTANAVAEEKENDSAVKSEKVAAREAKEQAKRVERMKKATARAEAKKNKKERRGPKFIWIIVDYLKNVKLEMKRVVWPSRKEVGRMSAVVIVALLFFGVLIYVVDSVVVPLLDMYSALGG